MKVEQFKSIQSDDAEIAKQQVESGRLSGFLGAEGQEFLGGKRVLKFEKKCTELFGFDFAISVNSWTSGLELMLQSIRPRDFMTSEVIVTPWTMSATVMAIIHAGIKPIFVDIEENTFMPAPSKIKALVTDKTIGVLVADIFGQSFPYDEIADLKMEGIAIFSDAAQAPLVKRNGKPVGISATASGISLNRHKHINTGEGGVILTNDRQTAYFCQLARNHGENITLQKPLIPNMFGHNFRMTETQAAIGTNQLNKLRNNIQSRQKMALVLDDLLSKSKKLRVIPPLLGNEHAFYIYPLIIDDAWANSKIRKNICDAVENAGLPRPLAGYQNIHRLPIFSIEDATVDPFKNLYNPVVLPVAERLHEHAFIGIMLCNHNYTRNQLESLVRLMERACDE